MSRDTALEQIASSERYADYGPATARNARALLKWAGEGNAHLSNAEIKTLFGVKRDETVRHHLETMRAAKLLKFHSNGIRWYVTFLAWENRP